ncbi:MAG: RsmE family RNA methyltransferase [Eubacteriales bacterium]|nr:RsmE family RNA methyltransferase [Eubacteriales bacterium]
MARLFVNPGNIFENHIVIDDRDDIKHIIKVLRLKEDDIIDISDNRMWEYSCKIRSIHSLKVEVEIIKKQKYAREPEVSITLFQGIPKSGKMETIIQKCTELGVREIVPVWNERTIVTDKGNFSKKAERWQKIADEASKQCKRGVIPKIAKDIKSKELTRILADYDLIIFPYENEQDYSIKDLLSSIEAKPLNVALIIGPEGGFSDDEAKQITAIGAKSVTLGKTILRTETAGMAAIAMIMYELEL